MRKEQDILGQLSIPKDAYYGIHSLRAGENFDVSGYKISSTFLKAFGYVKLACALAIKDLKIREEKKDNAVIKACKCFVNGELNDNIIVDPIQGGAGTSLNMNVNEIIANKALEFLNEEKGNYSLIDPIEDINLFQSTNDVYPTALKLASIILLRDLEKQVVSLQESFQKKEKEFANIVKVARTQMMDAVLITLGKEFSAYSEALARDRWRIYKCEERLRVVNIGGTAVGTGLSASRKYIFTVINHLQDITGLGLSRADNLIENTQNADVFSEVSGILKAHATNLIKISNDLRLLSSGPNAGLAEIELPKVQAGSSIMPNKINPVIPEMVAQVGYKVLGNDSIIDNCVASGQLELNHNLPMIAFSFIETLELLINTNKIFKEKCVDGIKANKESIQKHLNSSTAILTALIPKLGYNKVSEIAKNIENKDISIKEYVISKNYISKEDFEYLTSPEAVLALGQR